MRLVKSAIVGLLLALGASSSAFGQCTGQPGSGLVCGNSGASAGLPAWATVTAMLDRSFGGPSLQGQMLNRGASSWAATSTPSLGKNGGTGGSLTLNGSTSGSAVIGVKAAAGSTVFNLPVGNGTINQVLITDGAGNTSWTTAGAGTVSSVGLSMPGIFAVSGSPVIGAGTLTATLNTQTANLVWAGPTTGAASAPTFRALVGADLPNPSSSTLGGVQSFAAVGSQWIRQISTSGVPTASQPAFTDISGTLAAAQCPNPSASTIGCVQSLAAVASKWINTISTSGVPTATQPAFTDISGSLAAGQLPSFGNNTVLSNISGGTSIPTGNTLTSLIDTIGSTQGQVLYRNGSIWTVLAPGTAGFVLTTGGPAANPSWTNPAGGGTVTSLTSGTGVTVSGSPCTTICSFSLTAIADHTVLANISGGSAAPISNTLTAVIDNALGSTQGNILYRNATVWTVLAPGTNGQVLTQGASTPAWASAGSVTNVTISAGAGIAVTGTCTISTTGTCTIASNNSMGANKYQVLTASSGTYTTPTGAAWVKFTLVGPGGGGSGGGTGAATGGSAAPTCIAASGAACSSPISQAGGGGGGNFGTGVGGIGGVVSGTCTDSAPGQSGSPTKLSSAGSQGGQEGGNSVFGGGGNGIFGNVAGQPGGALTGSGGQGGGAGSSTAGGAGGGAGAYCINFIVSPAGTYTYANGAVGAGGTAGSTGSVGGSGGTSKIIAEAGFN